MNGSTLVNVTKPDERYTKLVNKLPPLHESARLAREEQKGSESSGIFELSSGPAPRGLLFEKFSLEIIQGFVCPEKVHQRAAFREWRSIFEESMWEDTRRESLFFE